MYFPMHSGRINRFMYVLVHSGINRFMYVLMHSGHPLHVCLLSGISRVSSFHAAIVDQFVRSGCRVTRSLHRMAREIRARIGSARLLLQSLAADESAHSAVSRTQCSALVESVKRVCLTNEEKASLAEVALGVQWSTNDVQTVAEAFLPTAKRARRDMQDFANIHEFFLQAEWDHVQASGATLSIALTCCSVGA